MQRNCSFIGFKCIGKFKGIKRISGLCSGWCYYCDDKKTCTPCFCSNEQSSCSPFHTKIKNNLICICCFTITECTCRNHSCFINTCVYCEYQGPLTKNTCNCILPICTSTSGRSCLVGPIYCERSDCLEDGKWWSEDCYNYNWCCCGLCCGNLEKSIYPCYIKGRYEDFSYVLDNDWTYSPIWINTREYKGPPCCPSKISKEIETISSIGRIDNYDNDFYSELDKYPAFQKDIYYRSCCCYKRELGKGPVRQVMTLNEIENIYKDFIKNGPEINVME